MALNTEAIKVTTKVPNIRRKNEEILVAFRKHMRQAHKDSVAAAVGTMKAAIKATGSVATRDLLNSVTSKMISGRNTNAMMFDTEVGFKEPGSAYAYFANYGRDSGGIPPSEPVLKWMRKKNIPEEKLWAILIHIANYGTRGHYFMEVAKPIIRRDSKRIISEAVAAFKSELRRG